jgi:ribosome-binding protein aMBF1 (putative translation factor)
LEEKFVEWRPNWTPEEEKEVEAAVAHLRRNISALRTLRERLGLSQAELSEILGTSQSNVSKMEARNEPRLSVLRKLVGHRGGRLKIVAEFDGKELELPF